MSSPSARSCALADLTDREQEILHLLAAGHTVKSIAASLGRSEAAIAERLRDARRKTGIGSSRELARLFAAQKNTAHKNGDRKTDLPPDGAAADHPDTPARSERSRKKGRIIMLVALPLIAGLTLINADVLHRAALPPPAAATAQRSSPLVGRWSLETARIPIEERPQRVTIAFRVSPKQAWTTEVEIVAPNGAALRAQSTAALDGVAVPVTGTMDSIDSVSLRQPAPGTLVMTLGKGGAPVSTRVYTVSKDRRTMTETIIWASTGLPALETTTFRRIE